MQAFSRVHHYSLSLALSLSLSLFLSLSFPVGGMGHHPDPLQEAP